MQLDELFPEEFAVYVSTTHREPSEEHHECSYIEQDKFAFVCNNTDEWIYFTLKSEYGCKIKLRLLFEG